MFLVTPMAREQWSISRGTIQSKFRKSRQKFLKSRETDFTTQSPARIRWILECECSIFTKSYIHKRQRTRAGQCLSCDHYDSVHALRTRLRGNSLCHPIGDFLQCSILCHFYGIFFIDFVSLPFVIFSLYSHVVIFLCFRNMTFV